MGSALTENNVMIMFMECIFVITGLGLVALGWSENASAEKLCPFKVGMKSATNMIGSKHNA